jgi:septum formation protein
MSKTLILASSSPRRAELLTQLGYQFTCLAADIDEQVLPAESAEQYVLRLARGKAQHVAQTQHSRQLILGADTSVIVDQHILGKPKDLANFRCMMKQLSARTHQVITAIAVAQGEQIMSKIITTDVSFSCLSADQIDAYWYTGEPQDKAGGYGIQGIGGQFITHIKGSYSAVVGLPLYETAQLLSQLGLTSPLQAQQNTLK